METTTIIDSLKSVAAFGGIFEKSTNLCPNVGKGITLEQLAEAHRLRCAKKPALRQEISALNKYCESHDLQATSSVDSLFGADSALLIKKHSQNGAIRSRLTSVKQTWQFEAAKALPGGFVEKFKREFKASGLSIPQLAEKIVDLRPELGKRKPSRPSDRYATVSAVLKSWQGRKVSYVKSMGIVLAVEAIFGSEGQLQTCLPNAALALRADLTTCESGPDGIPLQFGPRLRYYRRKSGISARTLSERLKLSEFYIHQIESERGHLGSNNAEIVQKADDILVANGTLIEAFRRSAEITTALGRSFRKRCEYGYWSVCLEAEFQGLQAHKTSALRKTQKGSTDVWNRQDSIDNIRQILKQCFGILGQATSEKNPLPATLGLDEKDLSISLLADLKICRFILNWRKEWDGGYTASTERFLATVISLLRDGTGYLRLNPSLFANHRLHTLPVVVVIKSMYGETEVPLKSVEYKWVALCETTLNALLITQENLANSKLVSRINPKERVQEIINEDDPIRYLVKGAILLQYATPVHNHLTYTATWARHIRNRLIWEFLTTYPMRPANFSKILLDKHLIRNSDGSWQLNCDGNIIKNGRTYIGPVIESLWALLDLFFFFARPLLLQTPEGKLPTQALIPSYRKTIKEKKTTDGKKQNYRIPKQGTSDFDVAELIPQLARKFMPNLFTKGISARCFRYILASDDSHLQLRQLNELAVSAAAGALADHENQVATYSSRLRGLKLHNHVMLSRFKAIRDQIES